MIEVSFTRAPKKFDLSQARRASRRAGAITGLAGLVEVTFVGPKTIRAINRKWRNTNRVTDVLSFAIDEARITGEIYICPAAAKDPLLFLFVHGLLHIAGYDHQTKYQRMKMIATTRKILANEL